MHENWFSSLFKNVVSSHLGYSSAQGGGGLLLLREGPPPNGVLPQGLHILVLHLLEVCTSCLYYCLFIPNSFIHKLIYTMDHLYQTQMYTDSNIPNLFLHHLTFTKLKILCYNCHKLDFFLMGGGYVTLWRSPGRQIDAG